MTEAQPANPEAPSLKSIPFLDRKLDKYALILIILIIVAIFSRFYNLGERVMSHDETTHVYFSWLLFEGNGYKHDPLSHGPLQFHLIALSYFLFGDNDTTARLPAAVFGVLAVGFIWLFHRWFGKTGALVTAALIIISPFMLYYSRYARNEALTVPLMLLTVWGIFRYLETRQMRNFSILAFVGALHFATKETAFIFTAQILVFLALYFAWNVLSKIWNNQFVGIVFLIGFLIAISGAGLGLYSYFHLQLYEVPSTEAVVAEQPLQVEAALTDEGQGFIEEYGIILAVIAAVIGVTLILGSLIAAFGKALRTDFPDLDLLVLFITMVLPQLGAIPATIYNWDPLNYHDSELMTRTGVVVIVLVVVSFVIGLFWNWRKWLIAAGMFAVPYFLLYSTFLTNAEGIATGMVGSLGYWLVQQGVERGSQPLYYYALIQLPIYEFLPMLIAPGVILIGLSKWIKSKLIQSDAEQEPDGLARYPALLLFLAYWGFSSLVLYSFAGEKMPWITVHIALPFILLAGWGIGVLFKRIEWGWLLENRGLLLAGLLLLFVLSVLRALAAYLGKIPPFQGNEIEQLNATMNFVAAFVFAAGTALAIPYVSRGWSNANVAKLAVVIVIALLAIVTVRTSTRAAYVNYDAPTEFLVYAHMARGPKTMLEQIDDLAERMGNDPDFKIAYDNDSTYPFWWYLRNYDQAIYFGSSPSRDLVNYPIVIAGNSNWGKLEPVLGDAFYTFEYTRIWWPNMDYYNWKFTNLETEWRNEQINKQTELGVEEPVGDMSYFEYFRRLWLKLKPYLFDPAHRRAAWDIWFNRDYQAYGELTNKEFSLTNWNPSEKIRLYIRIDTAAKVWDYGAASPVEDIQAIAAPYDEDMTVLVPDLTFGTSGSLPGEISNPHGLALAPDGSLYVADTMNHRIQQFSPTGELIRAWGSYGDIELNSADEGTFNKPFGVDVAPDGTVYVADTWNHRIQHFTAEGEFLDMFGSFGQGGEPTMFWGPRDVAIDSQNRIFVTDTGNKRVVVFNHQGEYITDFGNFGLDLGYLDEPVGIAVEDDGTVFVADTWNQRVQVFEEFGEGFFQAVKEWPIAGWYGQSLENKPYIAVGPQSVSCVTDPEGARVLCFDVEGNFLTGWESSINQGILFGNLAGIVFDADCSLWVSDSSNNKIMHFTPGFCQDVIR